MHPWASNGKAALTGDGEWASQQVPAIAAYFASLPHWWKLAPDVSGTLVTAGKGTPAAYTPFDEWSGTPSDS